MKEDYAERFKGEEHYEVVEAIKDLYITLRQRFVLQYKPKNENETGYRVPKKSVKDGNGNVLGLIPIKLSDGWVYNHLKGNVTIGLYTLKYFSKFICFDVDTKEKSRETTLNLVSTLEDMNISRDDIHVSFSGSKGYHVEMFFDKTISTEHLMKFYLKVLEKSGYTEDEIEYRPGFTDGLKLPLGIHRKTDKRCWYVNNQNLEPIEDYKYVLGIKKMSGEIFSDEHLKGDALVLGEKDAVKFDSAVSGLNLTNAKIIILKDNIRKILEENMLIKRGTRNDYTLYLSMYLSDEGMSLNDTEETINRIMLNTKKVRPKLIDSGERKIKRETRKIVRYVFRSNATLKRKSEEVRIYEEEVREVLSIKKWELKVLYLTMIVFRKQMDFVQGDFFPMAYSIMSAMGNTTSSNRLTTYTRKLEELGKIEAKRGKIDILRSEYDGKVYSEINQYKIKKVFNQEGKGILIKDGTEGFKFESILSEMFEEEELRVLLSDSQYYNKFYKVKRNIS